MRVLCVAMLVFLERFMGLKDGNRFFQGGGMFKWPVGNINMCTAKKIKKNGVQNISIERKNWSGGRNSNWRYFQLQSTNIFNFKQTVLNPSEIEAYSENTIFSLFKSPLRTSTIHSGKSLINKSIHTRLLMQNVPNPPPPTTVYHQQFLRFHCKMNTHHTKNEPHLANVRIKSLALPSLIYDSTVAHNLYLNETHMLFRGTHST